MKTMHANHPLLYLACAVLSCGCSTKPLALPGTSPERRANIRGASAFSLTGGASLASIDGQTLVFENSADISPGPHVARVCYEGSLSSYLKCEDLRFVAEAGHEYIVRGNSEGFLEPGIHLWIEDSSTGRVVAGEVP
jgi:hypothetical protein